MTVFDGARDMDMPEPRQVSRWSIYGPFLPLAFAAGMLAGTAIVVLQSGVTP